MSAINVHLTLRPSRDEDETFFQQLFQETEIERLCLQQWDAQERDKLVGVQYRARTRYYKELDEDQKECIVEVNGQPAGRMVIIQSPKEIRLADIALSGRFRGLGIGRALIGSLQQMSVDTRRPLRLMVEKTNPALEMYRHVGFYQIEDLLTHFLLEWTAAGPKGTKLHFGPKG